MKKIALLLAAVMLLGVCFSLSSCKNDSSTKSPKERAKDIVQTQMIIELKYKTLGGASINFLNCTYGTIKDLGSNNFKISGTVKVTDQYGNTHVANYDAEVIYTATTDKYAAKIEYGLFKKQ